MVRPLIDAFGRRHRDLRLSVTDRCSFRCGYCMPAEGMAFASRHDLLTYEEIERLVRLLVTRHGITAVRITGGEPTVRSDVAVLVAKLAALDVELAMTTNGASLALLADDLAVAGLDRVNVSLDSLRADRFAEITRRDALAPVLEGIDAAVAAGLDPVKVNAVVMRGVNDDEIVDLARFGRERGVVVRFIEFMPLDASEAWSSTSVVPYDEIRSRVDEAFPIEPVAARGSAPAERFRYRDGGGEVGIIPSVTQPFCGDCDRIRLSAEGQLRSCLFGHDEHDLRSLLRAGADDDALSAVVEGAVAAKWAGHAIGQVHFIRPPRSMSQLGG